MTPTAYQNRVKRYLSRQGKKITSEKLDQIMSECYGKVPPSVAAERFKSEPTQQEKDREKAKEEFEPIFLQCCLKFLQDPKKVKTGDDENWLDLRAAASYIALKKKKVRPAIVIADRLGLPTPAAVYHASYRAERLLKERVLFKQAVDDILSELK